ncbi:MAG: hypothetical protein ACK5WX_13310 [bacterium]
MPIPLPQDTVLEGKPVTAEQIAFLTPSVTTKAEIIERLGLPSVVWEDARVMTYDWEMRQGILIWAVGGYTVGAAGITDIPAHHLLIMEFDESWTLRRYEHATRDLMKSYPDFLVEWKASERGMTVPAASPPKERMP